MFIVITMTTAISRKAPLRQRIVMRLNRLDEQAPEAGPAKDRLDHDIAADGVADAKREGRHDRQQRVARRMAHDHDPLREALHAGHGDEILVEDFDHRRAHEQQRQALQIDRERQGRQEQVASEIDG